MPHTPANDIHRRTAMVEKRPALGKGLSALIPDVPEPRPATVDVDVTLLTPNPYQPRTHAGDERLDELAQSIRENGIIQPIIVRRLGSGYEIIAGERRWRAAQRAGLSRVPVVIRDVAAGSAKEMLQVALIENVQREDLNALEQAVGYQRLAEEFGLTQEQIAAAVGKDRSSIANYIRLLRLPRVVQDGVLSGALSMGHARALLSLTDEAMQRRVAQDVVDRALSVRETEALIKRLEAGAAPKPAAALPVDVHTRAAEERLRVALGTRVRIVRKGKGGAIEIDFASDDELQRLFEQLTDRGRV
jgi:ParB family chromosome partitioning protein